MAAQSFFSVAKHHALGAVEVCVSLLLLLLPMRRESGLAGHLNLALFANNGHAVGRSR